MKRVLLVLIALSLQVQAANISGSNTCDISRATQAYDKNGNEKGAPVVKESIKNGATVNFKGESVDLTIPWNAQEVKNSELFIRHLESNHDNKSWADEDSRFLQKDHNGFLYFDGPGTHRSVYIIYNCR
ncbi:hypothetical protein ATS58_003062 [Salmonella enterica subsp. enterica serovar Pensacola]|nr:hypothetical protein [Salmonella enterica subsp. enterica serovar Pensacola]